MNTAIHTQKAKAVAATLVCVLALVGLAASSASLSVTLISAAHSCCHTENVDLPCLTLCAASQSNAVLVAEADPTPEATAVLLDGLRLTAPVGDVVAPRFEGSPDSSPPLYVRHAALLI